MHKFGIVVVIDNFHFVQDEDVREESTPADKTACHHETQSENVSQVDYGSHSVNSKQLCDDFMKHRIVDSS